MTQACRNCGCTNLAACVGGCWWAEDDLCSSCVAPATPEAQLIEEMKAAGLVEVRPEDVGKPWADQRLRKTPAGELHESQMRSRHPEWFPQ